jgi:hypothetical protein
MPRLVDGGPAVDGHVHRTSLFARISWIGVCPSRTGHLYPVRASTYNQYAESDFDDKAAQKVLEYLGQKKLLATFFVVGSRCMSYPDILTEEYMAGHEISVHGWSHQVRVLLQSFHDPH